MKTEAPPGWGLYLTVYVALMVLLAATAVASKLPLGRWALPVSLVIATAKLLLVFLFFMQLRWHRGAVRLAAGAGFAWLGILGALAFSDYLTRHW